MAITDALLLLIGILTISYLGLKHYFSYWKRRNVASIEPNLFFGNMKDMLLMKVAPAEHIAKLYNHKNAEDQPFIGIHIFHQPAILIRSPDLIKQILIKDFHKFSNRFSYVDEKRDKLGAYNLFFVKNPGWRQIRTKLTPVFTSGKMKQMFSLLDQVGKQLDKYLSSFTTNETTKRCTIEIKKIASLYTTDAIATVAFGLQAHSFENKNSEFVNYCRNIFKFTYKRAFEFSIVFFMPKLVPLLRLRFFSKESEDFLYSTIKFAMDEREKSGAKRNDLIDILITMKDDPELLKEFNSKGMDFTNDVLVSQAAVFLNAGFETTSSVISFTLYELSKHLDMQERVRNEIRDILLENNNEITYDTTHNMKYLTIVIQEVLRLYPTLPFLDRECTLNEGEFYSMEPFSDFKVPNGMGIYIPTFAIHRDPKFFDEPNTFNPERFAPENKDSIVSGSYMPFGMGPHNCIGERLGMIQAKIGIISFLKNHYVRQSAKSCKKIILDPKALLTNPLGGLYVDIVKDPLVKIT